MFYIIVVNCGGFNSIESAVHASSNHDTNNYMPKTDCGRFFCNNSFEMNTNYQGTALAVNYKSK